jgi:hypothetical protein
MHKSLIRELQCFQLQRPKATIDLNKPETEVFADTFLFNEQAANPSAESVTLLRASSLRRPPRGRYLRFVASS